MYVVNTLLHVDIYCVFPGTCVCNENYAGPDCFVKTTEAPNLFQTEAIVCDSSSTVCSFVTIYNNNTINSTDLSCYIETIQVNTSLTHSLSVPQLKY